METLFQKIIRGDIPADKVYEDEHTFAFLDIQPINKGHTLVVPKEPVKDIFDLPEETGTHLMRTIGKVARAVKKVSGAPGINVIANNGAEAGQEVFHLHFHIIPRFAKEEFKPVPHVSYENDTEKETYAHDIAHHIQ